MNNKTTIKCDFTIEAIDVDPYLIVKQLDIDCSMTKIKKYEKTSLIIFSTEYIEGLDIYDALNIIINCFYSKTDILRELKMVYGLEYAINFIIKIKDNFVPGMTIEKDTIAFLDKIGGVMDFDMYIV